MNTMHLKYAVEVARQGSISKAADALHMSQPNLSRAVRDLESDLGISLFDRSARGMVPTPEGEEFLVHARKILQELEHMEALYRSGLPKRLRFSLSAPHDGRIARAFAAFTQVLGGNPAELFFKETHAMETVDGVLRGDFKLGIVRCPAAQQEYYGAMLAEKGLHFEPLHEEAHIIIASVHSPLMAKDDLSPCDLCPMMEVVNPDPFAPAMQIDASGAQPHQSMQHIYLFDKASRMEVLAANPRAYAWSAPIAPRELGLCGLAGKPMPGDHRYADLLIRRLDYAPTPQDKQFLALLQTAYQP